jgi:hypothetical protein
MYIHKTVPWLDALAFAALALGILGLAFFWMPAAGVCLGAAGLVGGFFGWITALQNEDGSAFYLLAGAVVSTVALLLNLALLTHTLSRLI